MVHEQLKERLGNVKPEPESFSLPWKVLEVDLIYDAPVTMRKRVQPGTNTGSFPHLPYLVEPVYGGLNLDAYPDS